MFERRNSGVLWCIVVAAVLAWLALPRAHAQSLKDLIQVSDDAAFATGFAPTAREQFDALPEAPRTRAAIPRSRDLSERFPEPGNQDRKSTRLNSSHVSESRMPSSA